MKIGNNKFNYNDLLRFLKKHKDKIIGNEVCSKLLYLCYKQLDDNRIIDKRETLELMDENYRKMALTNFKLSVELKSITEIEVQKLINDNKILDDIDSVLWYLINNLYS